MKSIMVKSVISLLAAGLLAGSAQATLYTNSYTYSPGSALNELAHDSYYTWGIALGQNQMPDLKKEKVVSATLTFKNIWDWIPEENDNLYVHLLDIAPAGVRARTDYQAGEKDYFLNQGILLCDWNDPYTPTYHTETYTEQVWQSVYNPKKHRYEQKLVTVTKTRQVSDTNPKNDLVITFNQDQLLALNNFIGNGRNFGFGIDPDCHYYDCGVSFTMNTGPIASPVPEPATLSLFGLGLVGMIGALRRKFAAR